MLYDGLPEPIDLELDLEKRILYWTDRGDPPRGNTVNRAPIDAGANGRPRPRSSSPTSWKASASRSIVEGDRMFMTDLAGSVYSARLDGSKQSVLLFAQGNLTGIAYAEPPLEGQHDMTYDKPIRRIAIVGTGVIGASWAAQYLARGFDVVATDPAPDAEAKLRKYVDEAWGALDGDRPRRRALRASA